MVQAPVNASTELASRLEATCQALAEVASELLELSAQDVVYLEDAALTIKGVADDVESAAWIARSDNN